MTNGNDDQDDLDMNLTLSERVARASGSPEAVPQEDGTILVELSLHRLEPSALPRPQSNRGLLHRLRRGMTGSSGQGDQVRYVKTRHGDADRES
jgi:hypothetical protein